MISSHNELTPKLLGTACALCAVTLLWLGWLSPVLFQVGTVLLMLSLVPLATRLGLRGGALLGLLFGIIWIAARLGAMSVVDAGAIWNQSNIVAILSLTAIGCLTGGFLDAADPPPTIAVRPSSKPDALSGTAGWNEMNEHAKRLALALRAHHDWLDAWDRRQSPWTSFDTHLREVLHILTRAERVRCYRVNADQRLTSLASPMIEQRFVPQDDGLVRHVLTSGKSYLSTAASTAPMVAELASQSVVPFAWVMPVSRAKERMGLVTVEGFADAAMSEAWLTLVGELVTSVWLHVEEADALRVSRLTDRATGVLNRNEFLAVLDETVEECYRLHEPVVLFAVGLEGIRRLDDTGDWQQRDQIVEAAGQTIDQRLRSEDVVGRFSDDHFVVLLRRLDVPLAQLIARKLLDAVAQQITEAAPEAALVVRGGLAGSGLGHIPAETLLRHALGALETAREQQVVLLATPMTMDAVGATI